MTETVSPGQHTPQEQNALRQSRDRPLSGIRDDGAYTLECGLDLNKDFYSQLWDVAVYLIDKKIPDSEIVLKLARLNKKLENQKLDVETLKDIKQLAYDYFKALEKAGALSDDDLDKPSDDIINSAKALLESGELKSTFEEQYARFHAEDKRIAEIMLLGFIIQGLEDPDIILHPVLDGDMGSGKSSGVDTCLHLFPQEYVYKGRFSPKSLYYGDARDGNVIRLDDAIWNEDFGSAIKSYMNNVSDPEPYQTLDSERRLITKSFPKNCMMVMSSVGDCGDDQLLDRMYRINVTKTPDKRKKHVDIIKRELQDGRSKRFFVDNKVEIIREALRHFRKYHIRVIFPDVEKHLNFIDDAGSRDLEMYKLFLKGACILNFHKRPCEIKENVMVITSAGPDFKEDIEYANNLFDTNKEQRKFRLSGNEKTVLDEIIIQCNNYGYAVLSDIKVKKSSSAIHYAVFGKNGVGGLVSKIPDLVIADETVKTDTGATKRHVIRIERNTSKLMELTGGFGRYV